MKIVAWIFEAIFIFFVLLPFTLTVYSILSLAFAFEHTYKTIHKAFTYANRL